MSPLITWAKRARAAVGQSIDRYRRFLDYFAMQYLLCCAAEAPRGCVFHYALRRAHFALSQHCVERLVWTPRRLWRPLQAMFQPARSCPAPLPDFELADRWPRWERC